MTRPILRRQFLQCSAGALAALASGARAGARVADSSGRSLAWGAGLDRAQPDSPIVIVGAGLAGLRAAALLEDAGRRVIVLEARGGPGGRVRTARAPFDEALCGELGAVRIAPQHARVERLVALHGLSLVPFISTNGSALVRVGGVTVRTPADVAGLAPALGLRADERGLSQGALLERYTGEVVRELAAARVDDVRWLAFDRQTWPDWLRSRGASEGAVQFMTLGGDSRELSALYVLRQFVALHETTQYLKIHGGMDQLPRAMGRALGRPVEYDAVVGRITERAGRIEVECRDQGRLRRIDAGRLILTVPLSTLARIEIQPLLAGPVVAAIGQMTYFPAVRVLMQTRDRFWHAEELNASVRTDDPAELWDSSYDQPAGRGLLGMTVGGAMGRELGKIDRVRALERAVAIAARALPKLSSRFQKGTIYRWQVDPWAQGAFAAFRPGGAQATMPAAFHPLGRVHFAGEHTSAWSGWMEGALESAERVSAEVLAAR